MLEIVFSFLLLVFAFKLNIDRISKRILLLYLLTWVIGALISRSGVYDLTIVSDKTIIIIYIHLLTFIAGFLIMKISKRNLSEQLLVNNIKLGIERFVNNIWFKGLFYITFFYVVTLFIKFYQRIFYYNSLQEVRNEFFLNDLFDKTFVFLNNFYLIPFQTILLAIFSYMSFYKRNLIWIMIGIYIILFSFFSGSRSEFFNIILAIIFVVFCIKPKKSSNKNFKRNLATIIITVTLSYVIISWLTFAREGNINFSYKNLEASAKETNKHVILYLRGPITAFDIAVNTDIQNKFGGFQHGALTFASIEELYFYFRVLHNKLFGSGLYNRPIETIGSYLHTNTIDTGYGWWNALYTSCLYYYLDFGILGVIILPFFLGILIRYLIKLLYKYHSLPIYIVTSMMFIILINTIQRMFFYRFSQLYLVIFLTFIAWYQYKKYKKSKYNQQVNKLI